MLLRKAAYVVTLKLCRSCIAILLKRFRFCRALPAALQELSGTAMYIIPELGGNDLFYASLLGITPAAAIATTVPDAIAALGLNLKVRCVDKHDLI